jgi:hypothetical protein
VSHTVPEGRCDRSLARSAWDGVAPKSRPVGYGVICTGVRTDSMIGVREFRTFQEENLAFLKKQGAHDDEKYLWD